jgi:hypothetical protein
VGGIDRAIVGISTPGCREILVGGEEEYPPGPVLRLTRNEAMVKHEEGFNPADHDWEFLLHLDGGSGNRPGLASRCRTGSSAPGGPSGGGVRRKTTYI